jgi:hypothetical protein
LIGKIAAVRPLAQADIVARATTGRCCIFREVCRAFGTQSSCPFVEVRW